jgi:agarase
LVAERYFKITTEAIKAADPNHMIIGCHFAYVPARPVVEAAGRYVDVISVDLYTYDPTSVFNAYAKIVNKPLLVGEFAFRGKDSGLPNTRGAGPLVDTQEERARCFESYMQAALRHPNFVGYNWFKLGDEPKEGRFDHENSNYGIVNIQDQPYDVLLKKMTEINTRPVYQ